MLKAGATDQVSSLKSSSQAHLLLNVLSEIIPSYKTHSNLRQQTAPPPTLPLMQKSIWGWYCKRPASRLTALNNRNKKIFPHRISSKHEAYHKCVSCIRSFMFHESIFPWTYAHVTITRRVIAETTSQQWALLAHMHRQIHSRWEVNMVYKHTPHI